MKFKEVTDESIIRSVVNGYKRTKIYCLLDEFQKSGMKVAEVDAEGYATPATCTGSIKASIKRYGFAGIGACTAEGKTYLVRTDD